VIKKMPNNSLENPTARETGSTGDAKLARDVQKPLDCLFNPLTPTLGGREEEWD
jgi:hypothetical protein